MEEERARGRSWEMKSEGRKNKYKRTSGLKKGKEKSNPLTTSLLAKRFLF